MVQSYKGKKNVANATLPVSSIQSNIHTTVSDVISSFCVCALVPTLCSLLSRVKALSIRFSLVVRFGVRPWIEWLGSSLVCRSGGGPVRANPFATSGYLVDPASSHMLVSKLGRCFLCVCCVLVRCVWVLAGGCVFRSFEKNKFLIRIIVCLLQLL